MADFELLAPGGHQKLVDEVLDRLDTKADIDGYYAQLTAGAADNLTGRGDATTASFLYRTAGGTADIETGQAVAKSIKGNTLVWNQFCVNGNFSSSAHWSAIASSMTFVASDNEMTVTSTGASGIGVSSEIIDLTDGHKYYLCFSAKSDAALHLYASLNSGSNTINQAVSNVALTSTYQRISGIVTFATSSTGTNRVRIASARSVESGNSFVVKEVMLFDLTVMFGAGSEPSTIEEFTALYPLPYYEYDAGSLLSVNMEGIETVGFNQLPEMAYMAVASAKEWTFDKSKCVKLIPGNQYQLTFDVSGATSWRIGYLCFDLSGNRITPSSGVGILSSGLFAASSISTMTFNTNMDGFVEGNNQANKSATFTPSVEFYLCPILTLGNYSASSSIIDPCLHLVWSGRRNGEYEPFWSSQREIAASTYFPDGMRSAGSVYDELTSTEAITRVGVVDLGTVNWQTGTDSTGQYFRVSAALPDAKPSAETTVIGNISCAKYTPTSMNNVFDGGIAMAANVGVPYVRDTTYTTAADFKAAMSGVYLFYELATPTVAPIDPALNLSYRVDDFGTERVMVPEDERSAPPVLDIAYGLNVVDFVRRAPSEYISAASFRQYLLARDAHDGTTTTMTWDEVDNRYEFAITDTVTEG